MNSFTSSLSASAAALASFMVIASSAPAQTPAAGAGRACDIDQGKPQQVARATLSIARAQGMAKAGGATKDLRDAVAILNAPNLKNENPLGRAFVLSSAYMMLLEQPDVSPIAVRSTIGLTTDPAGTIDLYAAADSAISVVEQSSPACATYMAAFRQQKPWLDVTNAAINALNTNKLDSAEIYARRSLMLDRKSPYAFSVMSGIEKGRKNYVASLDFARKTLAAAGTDTSFADVRLKTIYEIATISTLRAEAASGADRKTFAREGIAAWNAVLAMPGDDMRGMTAVANLAKLYVAAGDSVSIPSLYAGMIAEPAKYSESALLQAGVVASQSKRPGDAARLFAAVVARNPYHRDALNNLAASYLFNKEYSKVAPVAAKLVELDPSNPDNWLLYAFMYRGMMEGSKAVKMRNAYTDSLIMYNSRAEKLGVKVAFTEFSRNEDGTVLAGTVENRGTGSKSFTMNVDFLDLKGNILFTETATVGPVAPKRTGEFRIKSAKKGGVAGFRYKPLV